jgi:hypothetical protein
MTRFKALAMPALSAVRYGNVICQAGLYGMVMVHNTMSSRKIFA